MTTLMAALRDAPWLGADRALAWTRVLAVVMALAALMLILITRGGSAPDLWGYPLSGDFVSFWTAAKLALGGAPAAAWHPLEHAAAQRASFSAAAGYSSMYFAFFYPPPFLLILLPLALLPYPAALALWLVATGAAYVAAIRALLPPRWPAILVALAFPAVIINAGNGQNGALSTALVAAAGVFLDRRPRLAGACLGALCFKPQLALLVVPALVAARRWGSLIWAGAAAATLCLASLLVLGGPAWLGFLSNASFARAALENGLVGFAKMHSAFAAARLLGADLAVAWSIQGAVSVSVVVLVVSVVSHRPGAAAEAATIAAAACLVTPFLLDYDLLLLAVPLAWVAAQAERGAYLPWEKLILAANFVLPLAARSLSIAARSRSLLWRHLASSFLSGSIFWSRHSCRIRWTSTSGYRRMGEVK